MKVLSRARAILMLSICATPLSTSIATGQSWKPAIKLTGAARLPGSFVSRQAIYADADRIFLCSFQGDLFVLRRDSKAHFPLLQTIHVGFPLTAIRGDDKNIYVSSRNGTLYIFTKTWPIGAPIQSMQLSQYGLATLEVIGDSVYVAKGQAAMAASNSNLYISELNPGDSGLDLANKRTFGEVFSSDKTLVFDRLSLQPVGEIWNRAHGQVNVTVSHDFVYLTAPGCCGAGIDIYEASTLRHKQFLERTANTVVSVNRRGFNLLIAGGEAGTIDWYILKDGRYAFVDNLNLRALTGFAGPEDIEIRTLWMDDRDDLIFAGSSWGNDQSRSTNLPSLFILELQPKVQMTTYLPTP
jgi:hypothetical protein